MRKFLITSLLSIAISFAFGQITPEHTYSYSGTYTRLSLSGNKFYLMDVALSQTRIYNTNHQLWKTINLPVPANNYLYDIKYLSEGLFSSDNSLCLAYIYYIYDETNLYYTFNAKIIKENGTELLSIPGCQYLDVVTVEGEGTKLVAYCYDYSTTLYTIQTKVYSLPGTLLTSENSIRKTDSRLPFPNPAIDYTTISYKLPAGINNASLKISDIQGREIDRITINGYTNSITIPTANYPSGSYLYQVESGNQRFETGKFIVR